MFILMTLAELLNRLDLRWWTSFQKKPLAILLINKKLKRGKRWRSQGLRRRQVDSGIEIHLKILYKRPPNQQLILTLIIRNSPQEAILQKRGNKYKEILLNQN